MKTLDTLSWLEKAVSKKNNRPKLCFIQEHQGRLYAADAVVLFSDMAPEYLKGAKFVETKYSKKFGLSLAEAENQRFPDLVATADLIQSECKRYSGTFPVEALKKAVKEAKKVEKISVAFTFPDRKSLVLKSAALPPKEPTYYGAVACDHDLFNDLEFFYSPEQLLRVLSGFEGEVHVRFSADKLAYFYSGTRFAILMPFGKDESEV